MRTKLSRSILLTGPAVLVVLGLVGYASITLRTPMSDPRPDVVSMEQADAKLAPRGSTVAAHRSVSNTVPPTRSDAVVPLPAQGGPVPTPKGCATYATFMRSREGDATSYLVTVSSIGTQACDGVAFSVYYPEGEQYRSATPKPTASDYYWALGTMRPNETRTVKISTTKVGSEPIELCVTANNAVEDVCLTAREGEPVVEPPAPAAREEQTSSKESPASGGFTVAQGKEYGVWVWDSPLSMSPQKMDAIVTEAHAAGMNVLYVTVDDVLVQDRTAFTTALAVLVRKANAKGLAVDAVAGAKDWAKPAQRYKGYAVIDFVIAYNKANPKVRALQYDVEPYLLPEYERNKAPVLRDFVVFIDASARRLAGSGIQFSVVIPHFYDSTQAWTPKVTFDGKSDHVYSHLLRILDREPGSMIVIMAYRDYFDGPGGTREIVTPEIEQAHATKVVVAQETGNVEPDYVTYYGQTRAELYAALERIQSTFGGKVGFGGVAVHYIDPYLELRAK